MKKSLLFIAIFAIFTTTTKLQAQDQMLGEIRMFAGDFAPQGWALCDGQLLLISQNAALYSLLGTRYGGDGFNTFALPDLRGRVPIHAGQGSNYALGQKGGAESVNLTIANLPPHNHAINASSTLGNSNHPTGKVLAQTGLFDNEYSTEAANVQLNGSTVSITGSGTAVDIKQPYNTVNFIIALTGNYPVRN